VRRMNAYALLAAICCFMAAPSYAVPFQITVQATMTRDPFASSHFGITDPTVPIQISFVVESEAVTTFAAGTPVVPSGASFGSNAQLVSTAAIRDFVANIGSVSFSEDDLALGLLGTTDNLYDVLLLGDFSPNQFDSISGAAFSLINGIGSLHFSGTACGISAGCHLASYGYSEDYLTGSVADISEIQVHSRALVAPTLGVPEPGTLALFGIAVCGLALGRRRVRT
jgi:hypothetical protein